MILGCSSSFRMSPRLCEGFGSHRAREDVLQGLGEHTLPAFDDTSFQTSPAHATAHFTNLEMQKSKKQVQRQLARSCAPTFTLCWSTHRESDVKKAFFVSPGTLRTLDSCRWIPTCGCKKNCGSLPKQQWTLRTTI